MQRDITASAIFHRVEGFLARALRVGSGQPFELQDLAASPDGRTIAAAGAQMDRLEGLPIQRICLVDLETGALRQATHGAQRDRLPRWDPAGERIAYLSDSTQPYDFQLHVLTLATGETRVLPLPGHWVESLQWSADGTGILLVAAGEGADLAGAQGAISAPTGAAADAPPWAPEIDVGADESHWRSAWICDVATGEFRRASPAGINVWEACWCGPRAIACIASDAAGEQAWYAADVRVIGLGDGRVSTVHVSREQVGWVTASPSGQHIAFVEAACSDRMLVAGTLIVGGADGFTPVDTHSVDVTFAAWQGESDLLFAGLRGFESVLAHFDVPSAAIREAWVSSSRTFGGPLSPDFAPLASPGCAVFVAEGHLTPPVLTRVAADGSSHAVLELAGVPPDEAHDDATLTNFEWHAPDGLRIEGWLLRPPGDGPHPLVMDIHGGPVWRSRPRYVGRGSFQGALLRVGYAIFQPQPRGSTGRGQDYARAVLGDAGGADASDLLSGLDSLVERGVADPVRIGVTGGSYGGYMAAWLVTQDTRFAAAVPIAPVADWTSLRLTSHVPASIEAMLGGKPDRPDGLYFSRSPVTCADRVKTPTLIICGELDRSTPPGQAREFHHALQLAGATSVLLTYPGEGHGVRRFPAVIDFTSRLVDWFQHHMPA